MAKERNDALRKEILTVALDLFLDKGYERTRMSEISAKVGITPQLMQHYYPKKDELLAQLVYNLTTRVHAFLDKQRAAFKDVPDSLVIVVYTGVYYRLLYHVLCDGGLARLKLYREMMYDHRLAMRVIPHIVNGARGITDKRFLLNEGMQLDYEILCSCQAALVLHYFPQDILLKPIDEVMDIAMRLFASFYGLGDEEVAQSFELIDAIATESMRKQFALYFNANIYDFFLQD